MKHALPGALRFAAFQAAWFAAVFAAGRGYALPGFLLGAAALALATATAPPARRFPTATRIVALALCGASIESALGLAALVHWSAPWPVNWICPLWLFGVWLLFVAASAPLLEALRPRPLLAAAIGAVFGPLSYLAGERLGAITLAGLPAIAALAAIWAAVLPASARATR